MSASEVAPADVASIERATFDAVPPQALESLGGWLLGLDDGTVGRAHSAVPLEHGSADPAPVHAIAARYAAQGLRAVLRVPELPAFEPVRAVLEQHGYQRGKPTCVWIGTVAAMTLLASDNEAELSGRPDDAWRAVFLGEGFDAADGASRIQILGRAQHAVFARACVQGQTVAAGMGSFSQGWASVHGMRTLAAHRGRGLASAILRALAREAQARGIQRAFLQVEQGNAGAQALYRRAGFAPAWGYAYWTQPRPR